MSTSGSGHANDAGLAGVTPVDAQSVLRASRRRRLFGVMGGGMVGSSLGAVAVSGLNFWLGKPLGLVWWGLALGLPLSVLGATLILRIGD